MCTEFNNGDVIEYLTSPDVWVKGTYIGRYPTSEGHHVICTIHGVLKYGTDIRKPKQKKEGWMNVWPRSEPSAYNHIASGTLIYATKEEALSANHPNRQKEVLATVKVEWEE